MTLNTVVLLVAVSTQACTTIWLLCQYTSQFTLRSIWIFCKYWLSNYSILECKNWPRPMVISAYVMQDCMWYWHCNELKVCFSWRSEHWDTGATVIQGTGVISKSISFSCFMPMMQWTQGLTYVYCV